MGAVCTVHEHDTDQYQRAASISQGIQPVPRTDLDPWKALVFSMARSWVGRPLLRSSGPTQASSGPILIVFPERRVRLMQP